MHAVLYTPPRCPLELSRVFSIYYTITVLERYVHEMVVFLGANSLRRCNARHDLAISDQNNGLISGYNLSIRICNARLQRRSI